MENCTFKAPAWPAKLNQGQDFALERYKQCYMKKILFICSFLIISLISNGQLTSEDKQWNVRQELQWGPINTGIYKIQGDSIFNNILYKIMWVNEDSSTNIWYTSGLLREDSNRVFYRENSDQEGLLYDFNLQAGDTTYVISINCWEAQEKIVLSIDTVSYFGISRLRWVFDEYYWDVWIEDIGSLFGPLNSIFPCYTDYYVDLLCFYDNDTLHYLNENYGECYLTSVGFNELTLQNNITIVPNPVRYGNSIEVNSEYNIENLEILGLNGLIIKAYTNLHQKVFKVDLGVITPGLYLLKISAENGSVVVSKLAII